MNRHPVPDHESYTLIDETNAAHGQVMFVSFGPVNTHGYRGCGVFSCSPDQRQANVDAIKRDGGKVFAKRDGFAPL